MIFFSQWFILVKTIIQELIKLKRIRLGNEYKKTSAIIVLKFQNVSELPFKKEDKMIIIKQRLMPQTFNEL